MLIVVVFVQQPLIFYDQEITINKMFEIMPFDNSIKSTYLTGVNMDVFRDSRMR